MPRFRRELREVKAGTQRHGGTHDRRTSQDLIVIWVQAEADKRGERTGTGNGGRRRHAARGAGVQGRAVEAGGCG